MSSFAYANLLGSLSVPAILPVLLGSRADLFICWVHGKKLNKTTREDQAKPHKDRAKLGTGLMNQTKRDNKTQQNRKANGRSWELGI